MNWNGFELPAPYYSDDAVYIIHAGCREVLPMFPDKSIDLVLTDPPYVGMIGNLELANKMGVAKSLPYYTMGDLWNANLDWLQMIYEKVKLGVITFCSFHSVSEVALATPLKRIALISWYQRNTPPSIRNRPHYMTQYIWLFEKEQGLFWNKLKTHYDIPKLTAGCMATECILEQDGSTAHPSQKPQLLISELLKVTKGQAMVLDPFLGSGTTAFCAKKLGRKCIGIEIEERYCDIAAKRCSQMVMALA